MTKLGEYLLSTLNQFIPTTNKSLLVAKQDPTTYMQFFEKRTRSSFLLFDTLILEGKHVLDVGCGLGGNLAYFHEQGASSVTGIDISHDQISCTYDMFANLHPDYVARTQFTTTDASRMPFPDNSFDILVSNDTFEHVDDLAGTLKECLRVLRPGGYLYAYFPPFYAPWGAHMINWIRFPWCQVFFSEKTILNVARKLEAKGLSTNSKLPPETRLDLGEGDQIPFVSHLTVWQFRDTLAAIPGLKIIAMDLLPPGWRNGGTLHKLLHVFTKIPYLQEMFTAKVVVTLQKSVSLEIGEL